ncbi:hypothetical protein AVEN_245133-1 [Araneus ventricosus]|uniref:Uncharacterized protein n=1 Tax=Araneus ventricosus TaxID=182803 RepID=A0A4Y2R991_ARAVE|nr:hypothetical protein AVEN_245133-1 [Araneus ventricosus]
MLDSCSQTELAKVCACGLRVSIHSSPETFQTFQTGACSPAYYTTNMQTEESSAQQLGQGLMLHMLISTSFLHGICKEHCGRGKDASDVTVCSASIKRKHQRSLNTGIGQQSAT